MRAQIVSFHCVLKNKAGRLISETYNREVLTIVGSEPPGAMAGLNRNLQNLKKGERRNFTVPAEEAYGLYDPSKVILFPRKKLPRTTKAGETVTIVSPTGVSRVYRVVQMLEDFATLDGNHPLAGQDLVFEIQALDAREATQKDIEESIPQASAPMFH